MVGKTVLVIGGTGGIGKARAWRMTLSARTMEGRTMTAI
jgi:NAD(P)-dependent dehydrogenase (short-subunit alcohol dehydrogenase family)